MAALPKERVCPAKPFTNTWVDYAGPYWLRISRHSGYKAYKGYIAVSICLSTKAVHLEAVSSYDTDAFIAAFRRFVSHRGRCFQLLSDQGTNFVSAVAELRSMFVKGSEFGCSLSQRLNQEGTKWKFNPPAAPHFGGISEAAVKSAKLHLKRVVGKIRLSFEEFSTLLCQVEACLNSRPLMPLSDDPSDLNVLSPARFLIGDDFFLIFIPSLQRWRRITQCTQRLWDLWSHHYQQQLQKRLKWQSEQAPIKVGEMVLIRNETTLPSRWPIARVTATFPGSDGLIRVVEVRTAATTLRRPVVKLVRLFSPEV